MEEKTLNKTTRRRSGGPADARSRAQEKPAAEQAAPAENPAPAQMEAAQAAAPESTVPMRAREVDIHQFVPVRNGFQGRLVYISKHTGEKFIWDSFGAEQDMELGELKRARNASKGYFINNWFMFDDPWVIDYLGVGQYYRHAISIDDFDRIFDLPADEVERTVSALSDGQKRSVAYRARQLIADGRIDSRKVVSALEKSLGVDLLER